MNNYKPGPLHYFSVYTLVFFLYATAVTSAQNAGETSYFGSLNRSETALIGILYDLKQDQKHQPKNVNYSTLVGSFIRNGWDEGILNEFYRATRPLYTTQVFVPLMNADNAPRAFGVEDIIKPRHWVIHYKGQITPPHAGTFRFVGVADDILAVAVDGKTALVGEHPGSRLKDHGWRDAPRDAINVGPTGPAVSGDWFTVKDGQIIDLDIIIGERPGGQFGAWLMVEEQGASYDKDHNGKAILPVFQLSAHDIPKSQSFVRQARAEELWRGRQ